MMNKAVRALTLALLALLALPVAAAQTVDAGAAVRMYESTLEDLRAAATADPSDFGRAVRLVCACAREGLVDEADAEFARASALPTATPGAIRYLHGEIAAARGDLDQACADLRAALTERDACFSPDLPDPWLRLSELETARGDRAAAWDAYCRYLASFDYLPGAYRWGVLDTAVQLAPAEESAFWQALANACTREQSGDYGEQTLLLERLLVQHPDEPALLRTVAIRPYHSERVTSGPERRECAETARRLVALEPDPARNWWVLGRCLAEAGEYAEAEGAYREGLARCRDGDFASESSLWRGLVCALHHVGKHSEAYDLVVLGHTCEHLDGPAQIASLLWAARRYEDAAAYFRALRLADEQEGDEPSPWAAVEALFLGLGGDTDGMAELVAAWLRDARQEDQDEYYVRIREISEQAPPEALLAYLSFLVAADGDVPGVEPPGYRATLETIIRMSPGLTYAPCDLLMYLVRVLDAGQGTDDDRAEALRLAEDLAARTLETTYIGREARAMLAKLKGAE